MLNIFYLVINKRYKVQTKSNNEKSIKCYQTSLKLQNKGKCKIIKKLYVHRGFILTKNLLFTYSVYLSIDELNVIYEFLSVMMVQN